MEAALWFLFFASVFLGMVIIGGIIMLIWWLRLRKIKKSMPSFDSIEDLNKINYDSKYSERRDIKNGNPQREFRGTETETGEARERERISDENEIRKLREEIARRERDLGR